MDFAITTVTSAAPDKGRTGNSKHLGAKDCSIRHRQPSRMICVGFRCNQARGLTKGQSVVPVDSCMHADSIQQVLQIHSSKQLPQDLLIEDVLGALCMWKVGAKLDLM